MHNADLADDHRRSFGAADFDLREVAALRDFLSRFIGAVPTGGRYGIGSLLAAFRSSREAPRHDAIAEEIVNHDVDLSVGSKEVCNKGTPFQSAFARVDRVRIVGYLRNNFIRESG